MRHAPLPATMLPTLLATLLATLVATAVLAPAAHAQSTRDRLPPSTRDRLPPKQGTVHVAPPAQSQPPRRPDDRPGDGDHRGGDGRDHRDGRRHGCYGCYGGYGGTWYGGYGYGGYLVSGTTLVRGTAGLQAVLYMPAQRRMRFALNDAAYVAIFEIQPGRGVRLVFPDDWAAERRLASGYHEPPLPVNGDALAGQGTQPEGPVRWLYLVASDAPLGLVPALRGVAALESRMGLSAFRSRSTWEVTDALRRRVLTLGPAGTWSEALVAYRPGIDDVAFVGTGTSGAATVRCGNGVTYTVQAGERFECPR